MNSGEIPNKVLIYSNQASGVYAPDYSPHFAIPGEYDVVGFDESWGVTLVSEVGTRFHCNNFEWVLGVQEVNRRVHGNLQTNT